MMRSQSMRAHTKRPPTVMNLKPPMIMYRMAPRER
jgi:hypothetical protein